MDISYQNPQVLEDLYIRQGLSQRKIADKFGVYPRTISTWMQRHQIPVRDRGAATHMAKANHVTLSQEALSFIQGHLLGDGSLQSKSVFSARYSQVSKHREYAEWISDKLSSYGVFRVGKITKHIKIRKNPKHRNTATYSYSTKTYAEFRSIYEKWYAPSKEPPKDFVLNKISLLQWYLDDGSFVKPRMSHGYLARPEIYIANHCFSIEAKRRLAEQMQEMGIPTTYTTRYVRVRSGCTDAFFDVVGLCPVPKAFSYKWPS